MYAIERESTGLIAFPLSSSSLFPSDTSKQLISLSDLSDVNICYLASLGKYGKPVFVSVNYKNNSFILHGHTAIIGVVSKKHYYLAKEVLESQYHFYNNRVKRLSPLAHIQGNISAMLLKNLVSFMRGVDSVVEKNQSNLRLIVYKNNLISLNAFKFKQ